MPLLTHIFITQRKATITIWIVALGLVALIAGGGFRPSSDIIPEYQFTIALSALPAIVLFAVLILLSSIIHPEQQDIVELHASQPYPYWQVIRDNVFVSLITLTSMIVVYIACATLFTGQHISTTQAISLIGNIAFLIWSVGCVLIAILYGRDARIGQIVALVMFLALSQLQLPDNIRFLSPTTFHPDDLQSPFWWISRIIYILVGFVLINLSIHVAQNTDYLLIGSGAKRNSQAEKVYPSHQRLQRFSRNMPLPLAIVVYETFMILRQGFIPILLFVAGAFSSLQSFISIFRMGISGSILYQLLTTLSTISAFAMIFALFFMIDSTQRDDEQGWLEIVLSVLSPVQYLTYKLLGIVCAVILSSCASMILPYSMGIVLWMIHDMTIIVPFTSAILGMMIFGVIPGTIYMSAVGLLIGAIFHRIPSVIKRVVIMIVGLYAYFMVMNSFIGNIVYPIGAMGMITSYYWYQQFVTDVIFLPDTISLEVVVPMPVLGLPIISIIVQIMILWFITAKLFGRSIRQR